MIKKSIVSFFAILCLNCSNNSSIDGSEPIALDSNTRGSGFFEYAYEFGLLSSSPMNVYYHIPPNSNSSTPILIVFHGAGRNANEYRNSFINKANLHSFIVLVPEFSASTFPGGDGYNLGNVYVDGDNPTLSSLNPEEEWAFSVIEPLFDFFRNSVGNLNPSYDVFGHSAGGQFAHRFVMFKPNANFDRVVASGSGWYTMPDLAINFPYGFQNSLLTTMDFIRLYNIELTVLIGEFDDNPNASGLRRNEFADAQGITRYERAQSFFDKASSSAQGLDLNFNWNLEVNDDAGHDFTLAISKVSDLLFNQ
ncbi:hypothetical protein [Winogradskyella sp.]|uniref:hypothetical protein n=1 Tax=Winogradskyella sp. TaxID=1883156 RepID=UPI002622186F|nr:hypothetical protein [Winogradskyella sp.]